MGCSWVLSDDFLYKAQTKQICHITASKVNYHMTQISTNNKHLKLGISSEFNWLQNISLTQARHHDNFSSKILLMSSPAPDTFFWLLIGDQTAETLFSSSLIGYQNTFLIIIPCC